MVGVCGFEQLAVRKKREMAGAWQGGTSPQLTWPLQDSP